MYVKNLLWAAVAVVHLCSVGKLVGDDAVVDKPFGLNQRIPLTTSRVVGYPDPPLPYRSVRAFPKLTFNHPLYIISEPKTDRMLVVEQSGKIQEFPNKPEVEKTEVFLSLADRDTYGMTFHPKYAENRWIYVHSSGPNSKTVKLNRVSRFTVQAEAPRAADPKSELIIIEWESNGHNGGDLAFGPDGYLYISAGDGTSDSDTNVTGQDISDLVSGMIRIDVEHPDADRAYSIPKDNPFLKIPNARPELWAYGFRNPWRIHFDPQGNLWCGDIGQDLWEMIEVVKAGDNYGWSVQEGGHPFYMERKTGPTPIVPPAIAHPHSEARSITGGVTYLGKQFPELTGDYVYGDYGTGKIWACRYVDGKITRHREIADTPYMLLGFGVDQAGELYVVDYGGGVYGFERNPADPNAAPFPAKLSQTGLFRSVAGHETEPALIPYSVNSPLWSDGAHKERFIAVPGTEQIEFSEQNAWKFPEKTVMVKTFSIDMEANNPASRKRIETRLIVYQQKEWVGYSYIWNDEQTEAELVASNGADRKFEIRDAAAEGGTRTQVWHYPSRAECMVCHSRAATYVLGVTTQQMNRDHKYGDVVDNQLRSLEHVGMFKVSLLDYVQAQEKSWTHVHTLLRDTGNLFAKQLGSESLQKQWTAVAPAVKKAFTPAAGIKPAPAPLPAMLTKVQTVLSKLVGAHQARQEKQQKALTLTPKHVQRLAKVPDALPRLPDPYNNQQELEGRVRSYLHANCAQCHVAAGGGNAAMELAFVTKTADTKLIGAAPLHDKFGIPDAQLVAPGNAERSILYRRITKLDRGRMPPLATSIVDAEGAKLIREWIEQLK